VGEEICKRISPESGKTKNLMKIIFQVDGGIDKSIAATAGDRIIFCNQDDFYRSSW
jgi:hypothetical protein